MKIRTLKQIKNLKNKRVLLRVDFNVPLEKGHIVNDERIKLSLPTIKYLLKNKARVVILTHLGRPVGYNGKGKSGYDEKFVLTAVVKRTSELLCKTINFIEDKNIGQANDQNIYFAKAKNEIDEMKAGGIVMLENMRFFPEEAKNITVLSKKVAELGDIFVLDGFAVAHRATASVSGVAKYLPSYAGLLLEKEIVGLAKVMEKPKKPFVLVLAGIKMETKIPVLKKLLPLADYVLVGGGLVSTYLWAMGYNVGKSIVDKGFKREALKYIGNKKVVLPVDLVIGNEDGSGAEVVRIPYPISRHVVKGYGLGVTGTKAIYDIGPETIRLFAHYIKKAKTLVWNGPMGLFQVKNYRHGSFSIARLVAAQSKGKAYGVIGGGETLLAMDTVGMSDDIDLVSTGGGAMLEFLSGKKLPGIKAVTS